jgi:hypothetical protein
MIAASNPFALPLGIYFMVFVFLSLLVLAVRSPAYGQEKIGDILAVTIVIIMVLIVHLVLAAMFDAPVTWWLYRG